MNPLFFSSPGEFRQWLEINFDKQSELWVGYYKVNTGKPSMTWSESVDQALCFGWIDGIRKSIDQESYCIRFTPRKPKSIWSAVNIKKIEELTKRELMHPAGLAAFALRTEDKSAVYSYENDPTTLDAELESQLKANGKAWAFFQSQPPYYQKTVVQWILSAKQTATRQKRLDELIADSENGLKIKQLRR